MQRLDAAIVFALIGKPQSNQTVWIVCQTLQFDLTLTLVYKQLYYSDGTLVGVFRTFFPLYYVQKEYYKYFNALSTQRRHSEDDNVKFYYMKTVEDTRLMQIKPYTY